MYSMSPMACDDCRDRESYKEYEFQYQANNVVLFTVTEGGWFPPVEGSRGSEPQAWPDSRVRIPAPPLAGGTLCKLLSLWGFQFPHPYNEGIIKATDL